MTSSFDAYVDRARRMSVVDVEQEEVRRIQHLLEGVALEGRPAERMEPRKGGLAPRFPSTLTTTKGEPVDFYGLQIVMAKAGIGKSMISIGSAIESVATGEWSVVYFNAELDGPELFLRIERYVDGMDTPPDLEHLNWYSAGGKTTIEGMVKICSSHVVPNRKLLVVIDSVNSLAGFASVASGNPKLVELGRLFNFATQARKDTEGTVSFLLVSELNASGGLKGLEGEYAADCILKLEETATPDLVNIAFTKGRSSAKPDLGNFIKNWRQCRFTPAEHAEEATDSPF